MKRTALLLVLTLAPTLPASAQEAGQDEPRLSASTFAGLELRGLGPALMSGRIADIAIHPRDQSTWYVGVGSGGVWKTTNAGTTWTPLFDRQGSYSIGCLAIDAANPSTIWVGTGENVGGRHVGFGDGVYKSTDGGATWKNMGLGESEHIGKILVHPGDSDVVWVAAQGPLWSGGGERGLYKTTDGGASWTRVLGLGVGSETLGEFTGVNDVVLDPRDPDVLYAATHQRYRNVAVLLDGGPETALYKSRDGGATWAKLAGGLPQEPMGRIGLALSPQDPDVVYATIELAQRTGGFWRSADGGASWEKKSDYLSGGTGPHYYQELYASPHRFDRVYQMDVWMHVTDDGGETFREVGHDAKHSDNHALAFDPDDPDWLLAGSDGGLYESFDHGKTWKFSANLPVTQFYKVAVDDAVPFYNVYGGTQDNSTQGGPSRTDSLSGIPNREWFITLFADGHQPAVEPGNPDIVYSEWQEGNLVRYDRKTGEWVYIQPQPAEDEPNERFNWDAPILISPHAPTRLYYASQRVWRSDDRGDSWRPVSADLTHARDRLSLPLMGRQWSYDSPWDLWAMSKYGTITSLAESPLEQGLLYAGTDDGRLWSSGNGGAAWSECGALPGVPEGFFVNDVKADLFDANTVYVAVDQHKNGDFRPFLFRSRDRGASWESLAADLPERHLCWRLVQDHVRPELLFVGTEFGLFFSVDAGAHWVKLEGGIPNIPVRDLALQRREDDLVCATFGRGFWVLDDYSALRDVSQESLSQEAQLFDVRDAWWYVPSRPLGGAGRASQGSDYFIADNPPFGAVVTYHLAADLETAKAARTRREKEQLESGADTPFPGWDALRAESLEDEPAILLTVRDARGEVVRRLEGPVTKGFQRVAWNLRYAPQDPWTPEVVEEDWGDGVDDGALAPPGRYTVQLAKRVGGVVTDLGLERSFDVIPLRRGTLEGAPPTEVAAFLGELAGQQRELGALASSVAETLERVQAMRTTLLRSTVDDDTLERTLRDLERRLADLSHELFGDERRGFAGDPGPVSLARRLEVADTGTGVSTYGPTPTHRLALDIAARGLARVRAALRLIVREELPALADQLDAAGVPWTPGR